MLILNPSKLLLYKMSRRLYFKNFMIEGWMVVASWSCVVRKSKLFFWCFSKKSSLNAL